MGKFVKGDVVVVPFPFSDLSSSKKRPSLVLTDLIGDDVILCQITTPTRTDGYSIPLSRADFVSGRIDHDSAIRPNHLFTADSRIIAYCAGKLSQAKTDEVINKAIEIIKS
ncbi:MAG: type II toxin-antitoxin system PemK/MazF family toxin [Acidobacteriota bacterium]